MSLNYLFTICFDAKWNRIEKTSQVNFSSNHKNKIRNKIWIFREIKAFQIYFKFFLKIWLRFALNLFKKFRKIDKKFCKYSPKFWGSNLATICKLRSLRLRFPQISSNRKFSMKFHILQAWNLPTQVSKFREIIVIWVYAKFDEKFAPIG